MQNLFGKSKIINYLICFKIQIMQQFYSILFKEMLKCNMFIQLNEFSSKKENKKQIIDQK